MSKIIYPLSSFILGLLFAGAVIVLADGAATSIVGRSADGYDQVQQLIQLVNEARWDQGQLPPLKRVSQLDAAAQRHSQDMADHDFFSHTGSDGSQYGERMEDAGYTDQLWASENIAAGQTDAYTVMWDPTWGWMGSTGHRNNILSTDAREMGAGYVYEPDDTYPPEEPWAFHHYWTLNQGTRREVYPVVINREAYSTTQRAVDLYVYGEGWAEEMRFSNDGQQWSDWESYAADEAGWQLSGGSGLKTVWAQIRRADAVKTMSDTILLSDATPVLDVAPHTLAFLAQVGISTTTPVTHEIQVRNLGGGVLDWTVTPQDGWIVASPDAGGEDAYVTVRLEGWASLGVGVHTGHLLVGSDAPGVLDSPQTITVTLSVVDEPHLLYLPLIRR